MGRSYSFRVFTPLVHPFLCLGLAVTCSEDTVAWLVGVRPPLPEGEGLVSCESLRPLCNYVGPGNGNRLRRWERGRHGYAGEEGRGTALDNGLVASGGMRGTLQKR